jgi:hypothetical protein
MLCHHSIGWSDIIDAEGVFGENRSFSKSRIQGVVPIAANDYFRIDDDPPRNALSDPHAL